MSESIEVVQSFLAAWRPTFADITAAFEKYCTDDCVWSNTGFPAMEGKAAMLAFLDGFHAAGLESIEVDIVNIMADGATVLTERVDHMKLADGSVMGSFPVMGRFEVRDGQIAAWSDYFDATPFAGMGG